MKVFLIIVVITAGNGRFQSSTEMPTWSGCIEALSAVKMLIPGGGEQEGIGVAFCSYEDHTGSRWH